MKIKNNRTNKRKLIAISLAILLLMTSMAVGALYYVNKQNANKNTDSPSATTNLQPPTEDQKQAGQSTKEKSANEANQPISQPPKNLTSTSKTPVQVDITASSQNISSGLYQIRSLIGSVQNSGTCTIVLSRNDIQVTKQAGVQALASSSTCQGFDIPVSELSTGQWQVVLSFENSQFIGNASTVINIQ